MTTHSPPQDWADKNEWDRYFNAELSTGLLDVMPDFIVLRFLSLALQKGGRVWFAGCGLDPYPPSYAERGCQVVATDFSSVAVEYQQRVAAAFLTQKGSGTVPGTLAVAEQDFTRTRPDATFDVVINCRAFQGLSPGAMHAAAAQFRAALRPGGACILDTMNVQGNARNVVEDTLMASGFYVPFQRSERWYREQLAGTGIVHGMVMGRPRIPGGAPYPADRFSEFAARDQPILDSFRGEYERRREAEAHDVTATMNDPKTVVAHVVYPTG